MVRPLDENKRKKISDAAVKLMVTIGFAQTSMHKIAKEARVAASTIYLYFENKEDMLNKVYLMVKRDFSDALLKGFDPQMPIQEGIRLIFDNTGKYFEENPLRSSFMEQFENSALINKAVREQAMMHYQPVFKLAERGSKDGVLKNFPPTMIGSFVFYPLVAMIRTGHREGLTLSAKEKAAVFGMAWDAIQA